MTREETVKVETLCNSVAKLLLAMDREVTKGEVSGALEVGLACDIVRAAALDLLPDMVQEFIT